MDEPKIKINGNGSFAVRSWGDVVAVATLLAMLMACVLWGLKLESELNRVRDDLSLAELQIAAGVLPRAEERIERLDTDVERLRKRIDRIEENHISSQ